MIRYYLNTKQEKSKGGEKNVAQNKECSGGALGRGRGARSPAWRILGTGAMPDAIFSLESGQ
jgi:hypothetical protein